MLPPDPERTQDAAETPVSPLDPLLLPVAEHLATGATASPPLSPNEQFVVDWATVVRLLEPTRECVIGNYDELSREAVQDLASNVAVLRLEAAAGGVTLSPAQQAQRARALWRGWFVRWQSLLNAGSLRALDTWRLAYEQLVGASAASTGPPDGDERSRAAPEDTEAEEPLSAPVLRFPLPLPAGTTPEERLHWRRTVHAFLTPPVEPPEGRAPSPDKGPG